MSDEEVTKAEAPQEEPVDLSDITLDCMDDPTLVHISRTIIMYENESFLHGYDGVCLDCIGDHTVIGYEHLTNESEESKLCAKCGGTRRIIRTQSPDEKPADSKENQQA